MQGHHYWYWKYFLFVLWLCTESTHIFHDVASDLWILIPILNLSQPQLYQGWSSQAAIWVSLGLRLYKSCPTQHWQDVRILTHYVTVSQTQWENQWEKMPTEAHKICFYMFLRVYKKRRTWVPYKYICTYINIGNWLIFFYQKLGVTPHGTGFMEKPIHILRCGDSTTHDPFNSGVRIWLGNVHRIIDVLK